jgi:hypothetical protein
VRLAFDLIRVQDSLVRARGSPSPSPPPVAGSRPRQAPSQPPAIDQLQVLFGTRPGAERVTSLRVASSITPTMPRSINLMGPSLHSFSKTSLWPAVRPWSQRRLGAHGGAGPRHGGVRIDWPPIGVGLEVEMVTSGVAGAADVADHLA